MRRALRRGKKEKRGKEQENFNDVIEHLNGQFSKILDIFITVI